MTTKKVYCPKCGRLMKRYAKSTKQSDYELWGCKMHQKKGVWLTIEGLRNAGKAIYA